MNKILNFIGILIITILVVKLDVVNAAKMSCLYDGGFWISQDENGNISTYIKEDNVWTKYMREYDFSRTKYTAIDSNGNTYLTRCTINIFIPTGVNFGVSDESMNKELNKIYFADSRRKLHEYLLFQLSKHSHIATLSGTYEDFTSGLISFDELKIQLPDLNCENLLGKPNNPNAPAYYIVKVFSIIKYVAIVLLIVLTMMDFIGAIASSDNDIMNKTVRKTITRALLCAAIFLLPTIIRFTLSNIYNRSQEEVLCSLVVQK